MPFKVQVVETGLKGVGGGKLQANSVTCKHLCIPSEECLAPSATEAKQLHCSSQCAIKRDIDYVPPALDCSIIGNAEPTVQYLGGEVWGLPSLCPIKFLG